MGRSPSGSKAMDGRESQARSAPGEGWRRSRRLRRRHPLPNPSPIKGEGLEKHAVEPPESATLPTEMNQSRGARISARANCFRDCRRSNAPHHRLRRGRRRRRVRHSSHRRANTMASPRARRRRQVLRRARRSKKAPARVHRHRQAFRRVHRNKTACRRAHLQRRRCGCPRRIVPSRTRDSKARSAVADTPSATRHSSARRRRRAQPRRCHCSTAHSRAMASTPRGTADCFRRGC